MSDNADAFEALLMGNIAELQARYRQLEVSPVEVLEVTMNRMERLEPELNAVISRLDETAREQAYRAERAFVHNEAAGPLAGIPVSVKDLIAIAGQPMTAGSKILRNHRPKSDAVVHQRLVAAGSVVFAKTNMLEFAYGFVHPDYGQSNNPWDIARTAGGSSGGSAALTAAGIGFGSVVTDTGGSARLPAAFCGVTGLRPTYGSIDHSGVLSLAPSLDTVGIISRSIADNQLIHEVLTASASASARADVSTLRIGVIAELLQEPLAIDVNDAFVGSLMTLRDLGAEIIEVSLPDVLDTAEHAATIMLAEAAHTHADWYPSRASDYAPGTCANLEAGRQIAAIDYLTALDQCSHFTTRVNQVLGDLDLLACPTIGFTAPEREPDFEGGGLQYIVRTIPFSATGHPALSVPARANTSKLPVGLQLIARHHHEPLLHSVASAYEAALEGFPQPNLAV